jgi:prephenate dehydratase
MLVAAAFPGLNNLVFAGEHRLVMTDCFMANTPSLVIATAKQDLVWPETVASVDAPMPWAIRQYPRARIVKARSNADAALMAAGGEVEAALTTEPAAKQLNLNVMTTFGSVPMAWVVLSSPC